MCKTKGPTDMQSLNNLSTSTVTKRFLGIRRPEMEKHTQKSRKFNQKNLIYLIEWTDN